MDGIDPYGHDFFYVGNRTVELLAMPRSEWVARKAVKTAKAKHVNVTIRKSGTTFKIYVTGKKWLQAVNAITPLVVFYNSIEAAKDGEV